MLVFVSNGVDATDDDVSKQCSFLMYLAKFLSFPRIHSVIQWPANNFVLVQFLQMFYNLIFVATGRIPPQCLMGVSITKQISDFDVGVHCVLHHNTSPFVCRPDGDVLASFE